MALAKNLSQARELRRQCSRKVRHPSRIDARAALRATLSDRVEQMAPYPCKACHGWHNGHAPIDHLREFDPKCICGHKAITHESFAGQGCNECDCLVHREWIYRRAIASERHRADEEIHRKRRLAAILRMVLLLLPGSIVQIARRRLGEKFGRPSSKSTEANAQGQCAK
jgi:hypothetical protein